MTSSVLDANKALVRAHYDAVTNGHDPDAIRAQISSDFFDHAAGKAMSADDVIAHSAAMHAIFGELSAASEAMIADGDLVAARVVWRGAHKGPWRGIAPTGKRIEFRGHDVLAHPQRQDRRTLGRDRFRFARAAAQGLKRSIMTADRFAVPASVPPAVRGRRRHCHPPPCGPAP